MTSRNDANSDSMATRRDADSGNVNPTRRDDSSATRRDERSPETRRDDGSNATRRDTSSSASQTRLDSGIQSRYSRTNLPPELVSSYETLEELTAQGGEADLLHVRSRSDNNEYVIKLYRKGIVPKQDVAENVKSISQNYPDYFIRLLEYSYSNECSYEILEYAPNGSLADLIAKQPQFSESHIQRLLQQLSEAIHCLHTNKNRIVHRDLKPSNVMIRQQNPLKIALIDFGISSLLDTGTIRQTSMNRTVSYAPPEAMAGTVSPAFDYWSLGIILVELLTGKHPFQGLSETAVNSLLIQKSVDLTGITDSRWKALCQGLLLRDSKRRWSRSEIGRWLEGESLSIASDDYISSIQCKPYPLLGENYNTPQELALGLAQNWDEGIKRFGRGSISEWIKDSIKNEDLYHAILDIEKSSMQMDLKFLLAITKLKSDLEPIYREHSLTPTGLVNLAASEDPAHAVVIDFLFDNNFLDVYGEQTAKKEYQSIHLSWCEALNEFHKLFNQVKSSDEVSNSIHEPEYLRAKLLRFTISEDSLKILRQEVLKAVTPKAQECTWFYELNHGRIDSVSPAALCLMLHLVSTAESATDIRRECLEEEERKKEEERERLLEEERKRLLLERKEKTRKCLKLSMIFAAIALSIKIALPFIQKIMTSFIILSSDPVKAQAVIAAPLAGMIVGAIPGLGELGVAMILVSFLVLLFFAPEVDEVLAMLLLMEIGQLVSVLLRKKMWDT
jgi:eukaryotic-like serine/threonine-protein kinase